MLGTVDRNRLVATARALVASELPDGAEGQRAELVADLLNDPAIDVTLDPVLPGRPNVIARITGAGSGPGLLLNAHLDSAFVAGDRWQHPPREAWEAEGRLYGGGLSDMLAGLAAMVEAMRVLAASGPPPGDIVLLAAMHHDSNGVGTKYALANRDDWPSFAINGEPTGLGVITAHGGCIKFEVRFKGKSAHVSRIDEGHDALDAAIRFVVAVKASGFRHEAFAALPELPRFQIGSIHGGIDASTVPAVATVQGDLRTVPGMTWTGVRTDLLGAVSRTAPGGVTAEVRPVVLQRAFIGRREGPLLDALLAAHRLVRGYDAQIDADAAAQSFVTDAADLAHAGLHALVYGPATWRAEPNEFVDIGEMVDAAAIYAATAWLVGRP
jgi:acetylornithine deacetylase/succinyl-diaminopimelate desuccinylase